ncbi:MAG: helix-turn-helix domain-containing protein, partial [Dehalococcoidia bacterium]|nr:helix-turn-helix domain-containing protein [Dehalococcoidia bacterium]
MASIGRALSDARIERDLSLDEVAAETRISARFLQALEREEFEELPAPVYVRGFLRSYANFLGIDAAPLLAQLQEELAPPPPPEDPAGGRPPRPRTDPFARPPRAAADPFERGEAPRQPRMPQPPPTVRFDEDAAWGAGVDDPGDFDDAPGETPPRIIDDFNPSYGREQVASPIASGRPTRRLPQLDQYDDEYTGEDGVEESGVLFARDTPDHTERNTRVLAIAGVAVFAVLVIVALALTLRGGGGGEDGANVGLTDTSPTPTQAAREIPVASPSPTATATPAESPSPSPSPTETPTPTETATPVPAT